MTKLELHKNIQVLYKWSKKQPSIVNVPKVKYLMFNGVGLPGEVDFELACQVLFTTSYLIKFEIIRKKFNLEFKVNPMEVAWNLQKKKG